MQRLLRKEHFVTDVEGREIVAHEVHHHGHSFIAHDGEPLLLGHSQESIAVLGRERCTDRLQIIAGIEAGRNLADRFTQGLAIPQVVQSGRGYRSGRLHR